MPPSRAPFPSYRLGGKHGSQRMGQAQVEKIRTVCADDCCAPPALILLPKSSDREALIREAFRLEWLTIGWMSVEAAIAIASGIMAGSLVLTAFGLDSLIELASGRPVDMATIGRASPRTDILGRCRTRGKPNHRRIALRFGCVCDDSGAVEPLDETGRRVLLAGLNRDDGRNSVHALLGAAQTRGGRKAWQSSPSGGCDGGCDVWMALVRCRDQPYCPMGFRHVVDRWRWLARDRMAVGQRRQ
jgi:hypothetical protein